MTADGEHFFFLSTYASHDERSLRYLLVIFMAVLGDHDSPTIDNFLLKSNWQVFRPLAVSYTYILLRKYIIAIVKGVFLFEPADTKLQYTGIRLQIRSSSRRTPLFWPKFMTRFLLTRERKLEREQRQKLGRHPGRAMRQTWYRDMQGCHLLLTTPGTYFHTLYNSTESTPIHPQFNVTQKLLS